MCEQTNAYDDGDIVWVKLSNCWWPGEVTEEARLPPDLVASLKKKPFAVVKFFQEDSYEYVKNINNIYKYQCSRKLEFVKKGLDLHKSKNKYMEKFPADVTIAEKRTNGDLDLVKKIQSSPQKGSSSVWMEVFSDGREKKGKKATAQTSPKKGRKSAATPVKSTITPLTKTFISKPREHEVKFLSGASAAAKSATDSTAGLYKCHACNFSCNRINVIVLHSKIHSNEPTSTSAKVAPKSKPTSTIPKTVTPPEPKAEDDSPKSPQKKLRTRTPVAKPPKKRGKRKFSEHLDESPVSKTQREQNEKVPEVKQPVKKRKTDLEWKNELLADWSEDEEPEKSSESSLSHALEAETQKDEIPENVSEVTKTSDVSQVKEDVKSPPIKYRNIPKKDRRDIVLETGELLEINRPNISTAVASISAPSTAQSSEIPEKAWKEPLVPTESLPLPENPTRRSSRRKTKTSMSDDDDSFKNKISPKQPQQQQQVNDKIKENEVEKSPKTEETTLPTKESDEESRDNSAIDQSPNKSISCFDFQDEDEEMVLDSISKHRQKKLQASELLSKKKSRESSREVDERDEKLSSDIESLLKATIIPQIPNSTNLQKFEATDESSPTKEPTREIVLPPKERGKRIFKSKNRTKSHSSETEDDRKSSKGKMRDSNEEIHELAGNVSPVKAPTESDLQIAQTLINLPDHTPPLSSAKDTKKEYNFSDCKETNAAEVLMNLGNLTETRSKDHKKDASGRKAFTTVGETKIKLPENITVTKVVKPPESSPNHTKSQCDFEDGRVTEESTTVRERGRQKKVVPKKRKPNIEEVEEIVVQQSQPRSIESTERPMIQSPPASPKKIMKLKSQMKVTSPVVSGSDDVFDISNMPIVITDEPMDTIENYSIIMPETKTRTSSTASNGREQQSKIIMKFRKSDDILKSTLLKRVRTVSESPREHSDDGSAEESGPTQQQYIAERRLIKLPPKKAKGASLEMKKCETLETSKASSPIMMMAHSKPISPTKIIITSEKRIALTRESESSSLVKSTKSQVVQAKSGGQIVITSKGKLITKQSDPIRTSSPSRVANIPPSFKVTDTSKMSTSKLAIKSPAKIHVQSQQILYRPPKEGDKVMSKALYVQQPKHTTQVGVETTSKKSVESQKKILRRIKKPRRLEVVDRTSQSSTENTQEENSTNQTIVVHEVPPLAPITSEKLGSNCTKKVAKDESDSQTIRIKTTSSVSPVKTISKSEIMLEGSGLKKASATVSPKDKTETMTTESTETSTNVQVSESQSNIQDSQLLAIPGESFGGPANSFFLCTLDNGTFTPIDNQPLYLDASNQLVPHPPDVLSGSVLGITAGDADQQGQEAAVIELPEGEQMDASENSDTKYVLSAGNGQQILLDQQSLLAIAAGDMPRLVTPEGQELILEGSTQDILSSITLNQTELGIITDGQQILVPEGMTNSPNQDIIAAALAGTEVFPSDNLIADVPQIPAANAAQVSETNAVLTQPPIMSTLEVPTKTENIAPNVALDSGFPAQNLDDSLAVIGVTTGQKTNVPVSLELPITVTNPAIAPKTTTSQMNLPSIYLPPVTSSSSSSQISPSIPIVEEIFSTSNNALDLYPSGQERKEEESQQLPGEVEVEACEKEMQESLDDIIEETTIESDNACEVDSVTGNDIVPVTPESVTNHDGNTADIPFNDEDGNSSHSSEIPIQPDLILRPEDFASPRTESSGGNVVDSVGDNNTSTSEDVTNLLDNATASTATVSCDFDSMNQNADGEKDGKDHIESADC